MFSNNKKGKQLQYKLMEMGVLETMSLLREIGKFAGKAAGVVVGGPIQIVGELTGVEIIEDIGKGVRKSSEFAGDTVGQVASGAVDTVSGIINDNPKQLDKGLGDMGGAVTRTAKGVMVTAKNTIHNGGEVIGGFIDGDSDRIKGGASSIVKTVAIGALAVGLVDVLDGVNGVEAAENDSSEANSDNTNAHNGEKIETTNDHLAGLDHPETGVAFYEKTIELPNGEAVIGIFPDFDIEYGVIIDQSLYLQSDYVQFSYANQELYAAVMEDPNLAKDLRLNEEDVQLLKNGDTPEGFTWHHNEEPGVLQLVEEEQHTNTGHTGGRELWGGGSEYR
ncbi:HNH endonuclease [Metabacillus sp. 113a]|uniref:HNH endonuclease n=1 Tax=Metabacillus sp. 113a TaxID=3404706 RepID=UPI003CEB56AE